jgi:hypothetical protein
MRSGGAALALEKARYLMLKSVLALWLAVGIAVAPVLAVAGEGTLAFAPDAAWATPISDDEMAELRGGFNGLAFNIAFSGFIDGMGDVNGNFAFGPEGIFPAEAPEFPDCGEACVSTQIGNFQGFNGVAQIVVAPGDFNFIQNNLFIQIVMVNGTPEAGNPGLIFLPGLP